jgi:predicted nucleic acid-binding protein
MRSRTFLADPAVPLVADASAIINLIATGCAPKIIAAVPSRIVAMDVIQGELDNGRMRGRKDADRLQELVTAGHIEIVTLVNGAWQYFEQLVVGPAVDTLDDGEAATIAHAVQHGGIAIIDEKKATRLCGERFPALRLISTVDVLLHPNVRRQLGEEALRTAVFAALRDARMAVFPHQLKQVVRLIGAERAAQCLSLPRSFRASVSNVMAADVGKRS